MYNLDIPFTVVLKLSGQIRQFTSPIRFYISLKKKKGGNPVTMQEKDDKALIILPSKSDSTLIILPSKSTKCSLYPKMRRHITRKWSCQSRRACDKKALVHEEIQCDLRTVEMQSTN